MSGTYLQSEEELFEKLNSSEQGLDNQQVASIREVEGPNVIERAKKKTKLAIFLGQFKDLMILILAAAAVISFVVGEQVDAYVILVIIIGNALIGFFQENNAENAVQMLQEMSAQHAIAVRNNKPVKLDASDLVPGDIVLLEAGDVVPADGRLLKVNALKTDESALTGESHTVEKEIGVLEEKDLPVGDQKNMVFKGTMISNGTASMVVTATGMKTEIGKVAGLLKGDDPQTPLQKRLGVFSKQLAVIVIIICVVVFLFGWLRGEAPFLMFLTALSLAVAALPEALPAVVTIALSGGARRMVKQKALMRNLPAVETLGSVTYICSDKTGTLTKNVMTVEKTKVVAGEEDNLLEHAMLLNNEVQVSDDELMGDSTETAMVQYAIAEGLSLEKAQKEFPQVDKVPFDSERMRMSTLHEREGKWFLFTKGAPARIVEALSDKYKDETEAWLGINRQWAAEGLRVLFFAYKIFDKKPEKFSVDMEIELDFLGMVAMIDPPREEVIDAIQECQTAGIHSVMITGDQVLTAKAIAHRLNISQDDSDNSLTGVALSKLSEHELNEHVSSVSVYARVSPEQKLNIVKALQKQGEFVAMTGDGVNDAPSLKQANIGVAMGITGTEVSKEAADMILLDDDFATIVKAIKEGRRIYANIKKFVLYVLSCNLGEILTIFFAPLIGLATPLLPIHILWINLVTDGLPGLALASEPAEKDTMKIPPRPPKENLFAGGMVPKIIATGVIMAFAAIFLQSWAANQNYDENTQQTMVFTLLCFIQLGNSFSVRSRNYPIYTALFSNAKMWFALLFTIALQLAIIYVPVFGGILKVSPLDWRSMSMITLITAGGIVAIELVKLLMRKKTENGAS
ncbi:cation-translocating P-type ATPase [Albibacterium profundi]|uniref:Cation-translocating P-type ATPase n=1 Tax=Albibacterium profundi TaxID=3134906 RepID=A0ABV5CC31_9SPHI